MTPPIPPIDISRFDYPLPEERIARFPLERRDDSKLLLLDEWGTIAEDRFGNIARHLPADALVVFNNTKVVRARLLFRKESGALVEIFCLEPHEPASHERSLAAHNRVEWRCLVGNAKRWKGGALCMPYPGGRLCASRGTDEGVIRFDWDTPHTFGQLLELLGRIPIPPYLGRESEAIDTVRYQTVYSLLEGSVAAPTAGLHFTPELIDTLPQTAKVTLHVGAGTFLPVKESDASKHPMHTEHFELTLPDLEAIAAAEGNIIAVGTTSVRTLESLAVLGERVAASGDPDLDRPVGQWEAYRNRPCAAPVQALAQWARERGLERMGGSTRIMIAPGYRFRTLRGVVTNFHQPKSTLLLLIAALVGERWEELYRYALDRDFRFLSYGDSSLLMHPRPR